MQETKSVTPLRRTDFFLSVNTGRGVTKSEKQGAFSLKWHSIHARIIWMKTAFLACAAGAEANVDIIKIFFFIFSFKAIRR